MKLEDYEYGWNNGKPVMNKFKLSNKEKRKALIVAEIAFREMAEMTRIGSGDDQAYVDAAYEELSRNPNYKNLVKVVFEILKQRKKKYEERITKVDVAVSECCENCDNQVINIMGELVCSLNRWPDTFRSDSAGEIIADCHCKYVVRKHPLLVIQEINKQEVEK